MTEIMVASAADRPRIVDSLVAAFAGDPVLRHLFPADDDYPWQAAVFFGYLFDKRVGRGTVWTAEGGMSTAIWEPPGGGTPAGEIDLPGDAHERMTAYDEAVRAALPDEPFWYLGVLGTHPAAAGRRLGRAVMAAGLSRAVQDRLPAVLETSTPANVALYQRAGWEVLAEVSEPLPIWVMRHPAGSARR